MHKAKAGASLWLCIGKERGQRGLEPRLQGGYDAREVALHNRLRTLALAAQLGRLLFVCGVCVEVCINVVVCERCVRCIERRDEKRSDK